MSVRNIVDVVDKVHATLDQDESRSDDSEFELFSREIRKQLRLKQYLNISVPFFVIKNTDMILYSYQN